MTKWCGRGFTVLFTGLILFFPSTAWGLDLTDRNKVPDPFSMNSTQLSVETPQPFTLYQSHDKIFSSPFSPGHFFAESLPFQIVTIDPDAPDGVDSCIACQHSLLLSPSQEEQAWRIVEDTNRMIRNRRVALEKVGLLAATVWMGEGRAADLGILAFQQNRYLAENLALTTLLHQMQGKIHRSDGELIMDGHTHTLVSHDAAASIEQKLIRADHLGYDVIAITDHNTIWGAKEAVRILPRLKEAGLIRPEFQVIVGEEIHSQEAYILAYFIDTPIDPNMTVSETVRQIHRQGGLAFLAHPSHVRKGDSHPNEAWIESSELDGVELGTGTLEKPYDFYELSEMADWFPLKTKVFGGDSHVSDQTGKLFGYTVLETNDSSLQGIKRALVEGRTRLQYTGISYYYQRFLHLPLVGTAYWTFSGYDHFKGLLERFLSRTLHADNVTLRTTWDIFIYQAFNLVELPKVIKESRREGGSLDNWIGFEQATAYYGPVSLTYQAHEHLFQMMYVVQF